MNTTAVKPEVSATGAVVEVLRADDRHEFRRWDDLVCSAPATDAYYRPGYVSAYEPLENSQAVALRINVKQGEFLLPLLVRPILDKSGARVAADALTPYGYGGLLALGTKPPNSKVVLEVIAAVREWCASQKLVACLIRLHPLVQSAEPLRQALRGNASAWLSAASPTTAIDLQNWESQRGTLRGMSENRRRNLAKASQALRATWHAGADASAVDSFRELYGAKMQELGAREFFFFPREYYLRMAHGLGESFVIVSAWAGEDPVGAAIFLRGPRWAHYHLGATNGAGRDLGASTLLIHEGARWAAQAGCTMLHLGGGMQKDDSLMKFKSSFGGPTFSYSSLTVVADGEAYERLCRENAPWPYGVVDTARGVASRRVKTAKRAVIVGASGHAKVLMDIARRRGDIEVIAVVDMRTELAASTIAGIPVSAGSDRELLPQIRVRGANCALVGVGGVADNSHRREIFERLQAMGFEMPALVHPSSVVAEDVELGSGVVIMAGAIVNSGCKIGKNVILNTGCVVDHDCIIADHVHVAPRAVLSGNVTVGESAHIGVGATVRQRINIGQKAIVGAGAAVVKDVAPAAVVAGVPAKVLRKA